MAMSSVKVRRMYHLDKNGLTPSQAGFAKGLANVVSGSIKPYKKYR